MRAIPVLERIGSRAARAGGLAEGAPGARLTQEARAALGLLADWSD